MIGRVWDWYGTKKSLFFSAFQCTKVSRKSLHLCTITVTKENHLVESWIPSSPCQYVVHWAAAFGPFQWDGGHNYTCDKTNLLLRTQQLFKEKNEVSFF